MKYFAQLTTGDKIPLAEVDYGRIARMFSRNVESVVTMEAGALLRTTAIMYMGAETEEGIPSVVPIEVMQDRSNARLQVPPKAVTPDLALKAAPKAAPKVVEPKKMAPKERTLDTKKPSK